MPLFRAVADHASLPTLNGAAMFQFSLCAPVISPTVRDFYVWEALFACTLTAMKAYQNTGTGATVNAFKNTLASPTLFRASNYAITAADTPESAGSLQNTSIAAGDNIYIRIAGVSGSPTLIQVQLDLSRT